MGTDLRHLSGRSRGPSQTDPFNVKLYINYCCLAKAFNVSATAIIGAVEEKIHAEKVK